MGSHQLLASFPQIPVVGIPSDLTGLTLWLKADALGLSNNDPVASWTDSSGNANHATQGTAGSRPVFKTGILNGLPVVRFDAADDALTTPLVVASPFSIFVVYDRAPDSGNRRAINGSNNYLIGPRSGNHQLYNGAFIVGPAVVDDTFVYAAALTDGGGTTFRVDGSVIGTNANTLGPGTLGLAAGGANIELLNGDIAEVIVYDHLLDGGDTAFVENYITTKYGL